MTATLTNTQLILAEATNVLTRDEEQKLFKLLRDAKTDAETLGDIPNRSLNQNSQLWAAGERVKKYTAQIVKANLPLVIRVAKRFARPGMSEELFVSEGLMKLLQCINAFNLDLGYRFSTYLQRPLYRHFYRYIEREMKRNTGRVDSEIPFKTWIVADGPHEADELMEVLATNLAGLDALEKTMILRYYGVNMVSPKTLTELSAYFGFSMVRIKKTLARAIDKLKSVLIERGQE